MEDWNWKPRFDLDLTQRCLTIVAFSWGLGFLLQVVGLGSMTTWPLDFLTVLFLFGAFCKSSIQYSPEGKGVLITGESKKVLSTAESLLRFCLKVVCRCHDVA